MGDLLGSRARILASYPVCSTWVHVVDALLWPSASTAVDDVPDPAIGGVFRDPLAAVLPNASTIWCAGSPTGTAGAPSTGQGMWRILCIMRGCHGCRCTHLSVQG